MKAYEWMCEEIFIFGRMLRNQLQIEFELRRELVAHVDDIIEKTNFSIEEKYMKMIYLNFYIVADECLARIYKAICMYKREVVNKGKVRIEFEDVINIEDKDDITELFVDNILDQTLTGISSKIIEINKICKKYYEFEIDKKFIDEANTFRVERNLLVHFNGIVNKRAIKELMKIYPNIKIGDSIEYTSEKIDNIMELFEAHILDLYKKIRDFYAPSNYYNELLDEEDNIE